MRSRYDSLLQTTRGRGIIFAGWIGLALVCLVISGRIAGLFYPGYIEADPRYSMPEYWPLGLPKAWNNPNDPGDAGIFSWVMGMVLFMILCVVAFVIVWAVRKLIRWLRAPSVEAKQKAAVAERKTRNISQKRPPAKTPAVAKTKLQDKPGPQDAPHYPKHS